MEGWAGKLRFQNDHQPKEFACSKNTAFPLGEL